MSGGAPCHCPPGCARTTYGATQSSAGFPNRASRVARDIEAEAERLQQQENTGGG